MKIAYLYGLQGRWHFGKQMLVTCHRHNATVKAGMTGHIDLSDGGSEDLFTQAS